MFKYLFLIFFIIALISCKNKQDQSIEYGRLKQFTDQNIVVTDKIIFGTFYLEYQTSGKLEARTKAILPFEINELIQDVKVNNGSNVLKNQTLCSLNNINQLDAVEQAKRNVEKCRLNLEDNLINLGYSLNDSINTPEPLMKMSLIRSGYVEALFSLEKAKRELSKTIIQAPFSGVIANCKAKQYNYANNYKYFCQILDNSNFEINFPLLESEALSVEIGQSVIVIPFSNDQDTIKGQITAINPLIENNGLINLKAIIKNKNKKLFDGMDVKVVVQKCIPNQLIVPKSAVTLRQEKNVVFELKNDTAYWNYVNTIYENSHSYAVNQSDLPKDAEIIIDGNFNLSHLSPVLKLNK